MSRAINDFELCNENWSKKEMWSYVDKFINVLYEDDETASPLEIEGFSSGVIVYIDKQGDNILPLYIKNIRVEALKAFNRISKAHPEFIIGQDFYTGFLKGFCSAYSNFF